MVGGKMPVQNVYDNPWSYRLLRYTHKFRNFNKSNKKYIHLYKLNFNIIYK